MTSAAEFIDDLRAKALAHDAVTHAFLRRLKDGSLPDTQASLRHLAFQWREFGRYYPRFVRTVLRKLETPAHIDVFERLLSEELGRDGRALPHTDAFAVFQSAVGVDTDYRACHRVIPEAENWAAGTFKLCNSDNPASGVSVIAIACDMIAPAIHGRILGAIEAHTDLDSAAQLFFTRHIAESEARAEELKSVLVDFAADEENRPIMRGAVYEALDLRARFWRALLMISLASIGTDAQRAAG